MSAQWALPAKAEPAMAVKNTKLDGVAWANK